MKRSIGTFIFILTVLFGTNIFSFGQQKQAPPDVVFKMDQEQMMHQRIAPFPPMPPEGDFVFYASEMSFSGKLVQGAPYSAEAITESVQTLSDGNRIVNKSTALLYRDSEGRTRREQALKAIGPFANSGEPSQSIYISDPVADVSYVLDPRTHIARKMPRMGFKFFEYKLPPPGEAKPGKVVEEAPERVEVQANVLRKATEGDLLIQRNATGTRFVTGWRNHVGRTESLGKQNIGGLEAEGTRSTVTIPAGEIGNERPIEIVSERWFSPELQIVVMTRHSDPRFGETTYRLTNIDRSEPARSLFEVPTGYTLKEGLPTPPPDLSGAISGGVLNGKAISLPQPTYPPIARQARASGTVTVQVTIDEDGNVISAKAVFGHPLLQAAAVTAARQAKFSPTKLEGQPVKVQGVLTYNFAQE